MLLSSLCKCTHRWQGVVIVSEYIMDAIGIYAICCTLNSSTNWHRWNMLHVHNFSSNGTWNRERLLPFKGSTAELIIQGTINSKFNFGTVFKYWVVLIWCLFTPIEIFLMKTLCKDQKSNYLQDKCGQDNTIAMYHITGWVSRDQQSVCMMRTQSGNVFPLMALALLLFIAEHPDHKQAH